MFRFGFGKNVSVSVVHYEAVIEAEGGNFEKTLQIMCSKVTQKFELTSYFCQSATLFSFSRDFRIFSHAPCRCEKSRQIVMHVHIVNGR